MEASSDSWGKTSCVEFQIADTLVLKHVIGSKKSDNNESQSNIKEKQTSIGFDQYNSASEVDDCSSLLAFLWDEKKKNFLTLTLKILSSVHVDMMKMV